MREAPMNIINYDEKFSLYRNYYNNYILAFIPENKTVLDVGCSGGQLGRCLIEQKNCTVFGVDISSTAIRQAKKTLHAAQVMDVEKDPLPFAGQLFEVIVFCDILEHLWQPEKVLQSFQHYLKPGGIMVASIPNVANISIRLKLLLGRWDYQPSGILDEGHVRFYTRRTMRSLFEKSGLRLRQEGSAPRYGCETISRLWPTLLANQFIFVLEKSAAART